MGTPTTAVTIPARFVPAVNAAAWLELGYATDSLDHQEHLDDIREQLDRCSALVEMLEHFREQTGADRTIDGPLAAKVLELAFSVARDDTPRVPREELGAHADYLRWLTEHAPAGEWDGVPA